jgi:hypothetical protein
VRIEVVVQNNHTRRHGCTIGDEKIVDRALRGVTSVDRKQARSPDPVHQIDRRYVEARRLPDVNVARLPRVSPQVGFESFQVSATGPVNVPFLFGEEIDSETVFVRRSRQVQDEPQLAVVNSDLSGGPTDTVQTLELRDTRNHTGGERVEPALDRAHAAVQVALNRSRRHRTGVTTEATIGSSSSLEKKLPEIVG